MGSEPGLFYYYESKAQNSKGIDIQLQKSYKEINRYATEHSINVSINGQTIKLMQDDKGNN